MSAVFTYSSTETTRIYTAPLPSHLYVCRF